MSSTSLLARPRTRLSAFRLLRLSANAAFYLQASIVVSLLAGSSAPTPLYAVYQAAWGFSPITVTVIFGVYALAVLTALLTVGSLSDHVGRRPVLMVALVMQAVTMVIFATADGVSDLLVGRVLQGLSTGAAVSALGAGMLDLNRVRGTLANAIAPLTGTATGAIGSSILVQYLPQPTHLVYLVLVAVFMLQAIGVMLMPETSTRKPGALVSLRPHFAVPAGARQSMLLAIPVLVAVWSLAGFYLSLGPTLVRLMSHSDSFLLGGLAPFAVAGGGGVAVLLLRSAAARTMVVLGMIALVAGVGLTVFATVHLSGAVLFLGTAVAGVGFGAGFQGALRTVVPIAEPHERAGVLSTLFVVSYLSLGVPAVVGGILAVHGGVLAAGREYSVAVMVLATLALLGSIWSMRTAQTVPWAAVSQCPSTALLRQTR